MRFWQPTWLRRSFDETRHKIPRIAIPPEWPRFLGLDFGGVNTAGVFFAHGRDAYHKPTGLAAHARVNSLADFNSWR